MRRPRRVDQAAGLGRARVAHLPRDVGRLLAADGPREPAVAHHVRVPHVRHAIVPRGVAVSARDGRVVGLAIVRLDEQHGHGRVRRQKVAEEGLHRVAPSQPAARRVAVEHVVRRVLEQHERRQAGGRVGVVLTEDHRQRRQLAAHRRAAERVRDPVDPPAQRL
eukprot:4577910-Prymnesium_polylepis.1